MTQKEPIYLQVCAGFANRLRATVSGICAAEEMGRSICISWPREAAFGATWADLFDLSASRLPVWLTFDDRHENDLQMCNSAADWLTVQKRSTIRIKSYGIFFKPSEERWLYWLRRLQPRPEFLHILEGRPVGVHIRRTDHRKAIEQSPTVAFLKAMDAYPRATTFFLATDDPAERTLVASRYHGRIVGLYATHYRRDILEGVQEAFAEFMQLTQCSEIIGSAASSFSEMAAAYGGCRLHTIVNK